MVEETISHDIFYNKVLNHAQDTSGIVVPLHNEHNKSVQAVKRINIVEKMQISIS